MVTIFLIRALTVSALVLSASALAQYIPYYRPFQVDVDCRASRNTAGLRMANVNGQTIVVGTCGPLTGPTSAFFGHPDTGFTVIEFEPGNSNSLVGINSGGSMVGRATGVDGTTRSYVVEPTGSIAPLLIDGCSNVAAFNVNDSGIIVGACDTRGFIWTVDGTSILEYPSAVTTTLTDLVVEAAGNYYTSGYILGAEGQIHGIAGDPQGSLTIFDAPNALATLPLGVNGNHTIVGSYIDPAFHLHGFFTNSPQETPTSLDVPDATDTFIGGIVMARDIVGYYDLGNSLSGFIGSFNFGQPVGNSASVSLVPAENQHW